MGIETHALNLLRYVSGRHPLGAVATIGRQELALPAETRHQFGLAEGERYCEGLLAALGAQLVHSFDVSAYEDATYICDLNEPYQPEQVYDTVCDFGSLEHVFDQATAFSNVRRMVRVSGLVCHVLPVNNLSGHGFWQYSSDLLYEIYSPENGFENTEVFYASSMNHRWWYRAARPNAGVRVEALSLEPMILLCISRKAEVRTDALRASQKFYDLLWNAPRAHAPRYTSHIKKILPRGTAAYAALRNAHLLFGLVTGSSRYALSAKNPALEPVKVESLVSPRPR